MVTGFMVVVRQRGERLSQMTLRAVHRPLPPTARLAYNLRAARGASPLIEVGTVFADRWEVVAPLARGSTSEVFRGVDRQGGESVALKVLLAKYARNEESLQRFRREARVAQKLAHPNIVAIRAFGVDGGRPWIAMELLEGETLEVRLQRGAMEAAVVLDMLEQIASAMDHAHAQGVVHRDLKPDNCFLLAGDGARVKVLDFGFAKVLDMLESDGLKTSSNAVLGTPLYMAPEQVRSSATVDVRADLWSLGVIAYELLVGDAPFEANSTADLFVEILSRPIPPPSTRVVTLPRALDRWMLRALDRAPEGRFRSGQEFMRTLRAAMDPKLARELGSVTAPHVAVKPPRPPAGANRRLTALFGVGIVALLAVLWALASLR